MWWTLLWRPGMLDATVEQDAIPPGRILLLGASGLIGSHVLEQLAGAPAVEVVASSHARPPHLQASNVTWRTADLRDPVACANLMEGADRVLLAAGIVATAPVLASDPIAPIRDNLRIAEHVFAAAWRARVRSVVWLSSTTGYPESATPLDEEQMFEGEPPAAWRLLGGATRWLETLARGLAERSDAHTAFVALRPSLVYGERDDFSFERGHFVPALIRRVVERQDPLEVWGSGEERRDLVHAADVAAAMLRATRLVGCHAFNVASGTSPSVNELLAKLIEIEGHHGARIVHLPGRPRSVGERRFTNERLRAALGFVPRIDLETGLIRTCDWFRAHREQARLQDGLLPQHGAAGPGRPES